MNNLLDIVQRESTRETIAGSPDRMIEMRRNHMMADTLVTEPDGVTTRTKTAIVAEGETATDGVDEMKRTDDFLREITAVVAIEGRHLTVITPIDPVDGTITIITALLLVVVARYGLLGGLGDRRLEGLRLVAGDGAYPHRRRSQPQSTIDPLRIQNGAESSR